VYSVGYIIGKKKKKKTVTHNKLSWVYKQIEGDENIIAEMERDTELRNRERGIRDLGVERVGLLDKRRILFIPSGIPIHLRKGITIPLNNIQPNKGIAIM